MSDISVLGAPPFHLTLLHKKGGLKSRNENHHFFIHFTTKQQHADELVLISLHT
jgi:hypothetical protein